MFFHAGPRTAVVPVVAHSRERIAVGAVRYEQRPLQRCRRHRRIAECFRGRRRDGIRVGGCREKCRPRPYLCVAERNPTGWFELHLLPNRKRVLRRKLRHECVANERALLTAEIVHVSRALQRAGLVLYRNVTRGDKTVCAEVVERVRCVDLYLSDVHGRAAVRDQQPSIGIERNLLRGHDDGVRLRRHLQGKQEKEAEKDCRAGTHAKKVPYSRGRTSVASISLQYVCATVRYTECTVRETRRAPPRDERPRARRAPTMECCRACVSGGRRVCPRACRAIWR